MKKEVSKRTGSSFLENIRNGRAMSIKNRRSMSSPGLVNMRAKTTARLLVTIQTMRANFVCLIRNKIMATKRLTAKQAVMTIPMVSPSQAKEKLHALDNRKKILQHNRRSWSSGSDQVQSEKAPLPLAD
ncbi:MAG: hypothetical protein O3A90_01950 [Proteobacteria bacterium]|nr:hypothetical protein [Pseudomonadota bacterium]